MAYDPYWHTYVGFVLEDEHGGMYADYEKIYKSETSAK